MIKTFRGLLTDGQQERIRLERRDGKTGYRIVKLEIIANQPGVQTQESVIKVFSIRQTLIDGLINFSDITLLACGYYRDNNNDIYPTSTDIIFDRITFNQDIFITHKDVSVGQECNYYLELEQIALDETEATAVILKNFRNTNTVA